MTRAGMIHGPWWVKSRSYVYSQKSSDLSNVSKTYENNGNKSHQTATNNTQRTSIIHFEINRNMLSWISNKIVIFDFDMISMSDLKVRS